MRTWTLFSEKNRLSRYLDTLHHIHGIMLKTLGYIQGYDSSPFIMFTFVRSEPDTDPLMLLVVGHGSNIDEPNFLFLTRILYLSSCESIESLLAS